MHSRGHHLLLEDVLVGAASFERGGDLLRRGARAGGHRGGLEHALLVLLLPVGGCGARRGSLRGSQRRRRLVALDQLLQRGEELRGVHRRGRRRLRSRRPRPDGAGEPGDDRLDLGAVVGIGRDVALEVVERLRDPAQIHVGTRDVVEEIGVRLDLVRLLQLGDPSLHLSRADERHALAEVPLRLRARIGKSGGRPEKRDEKRAGDRA